MKKIPNVVLSTHNPIDYVNIKMPSLKESRRNLKVVKSSITIKGSVKYFHGPDSIEWIRNESNSRIHYRGDFSSVDEIDGMIYGQTDHGNPTPPMPLNSPMQFIVIPQEENTVLACFQYNFFNIKKDEKLTLRNTYVLDAQQTISLNCKANMYLYNIDSDISINSRDYNLGSWFLVKEPKQIYIKAKSDLVLAVFD